MLKNLSTFSILALCLLIIACGKNSVTHNSSDHKYTNALIEESSPYLLQHAHNPVNWYPWGEEALTKAKNEDKMLIISVGYAACHWCHVMEHESFEDSLVASIMNENFICIKVDREERPDVDNVYMSACQLTSRGSCGWPLNAFALADGRPVWAGTYFPKDEWINILQQFIRLKQNDPEKIEETAANIASGMQSYDQLEVVTGDVDYTLEELTDIGDKFLSNIDFKNGGRNGSPKFPMPNNYEFLLKYNHLTGDEKALEAVTTTLDKMALGGIYDQLGGGFARYSVDDVWLVPHFEKMLYDNGQLVDLYAQAYQKTKSPLYKKVVEQSIGFVERELMSEENGFYSSLDADTEGEEGKFYVFSKEEIYQVIGDEKSADIFSHYYDVSEKGNWEHTNILNVVKTKEEVLKKYDLTSEDFDKIMDSARAKLFDFRSKRVRPGLDDKILASWNALMLSGYVSAYNALGNKDYLATAIKNGNFLKSKMVKEDFRLDRNYKNGKSSINGFLDDYALTIKAFLDLYQATFDESWLDAADGLAKYTIQHFFNDETKIFNYTSDLDPPLVSNKVELSDNVIPGSNSSIARALFYLGTYKDNNEYKDISKQMLKNIVGQIAEIDQPNFYSNWCQFYVDLVKPPYEVAIVGNDAMDKRNQLAQTYISNALLLGGETEGNLSLLKDKLQEGETMIYVCQNKVCKFPVTEVDKAISLMD